MKKLRNPKPTYEDYCIVCGTGFAELHEIFFGKNSQLSKRYGCQVRLCFEHHRGTYGVHGKNGHELDKGLKQKGQLDFENRYPDLSFLKIFGKNYV